MSNEKTELKPEQLEETKPAAKTLAPKPKTKAEADAEALAAFERS